MAKSKRLFVDGAHGQLHVRRAEPEHPTRRPLVCLHMFPQSSHGFKEFMEVASGDRIVVAHDFPGHGESDAPLERITAEDYARSIWQVVDALSLLESHGTVDLFGIHAGAKLAVEGAHQRPQDVHRIVLSSAAVLYPDEIKSLKETFHPIALDEEGTRFRALWAILVRGRHPDMTLEMCANSFADFLRAGEKREWGHDAVFDYNLKFPDIMASLPHPIALLNPKDELYDMTLRSLDYLRHVKLFDLPDWGHGFLEVHAEIVDEMVRPWLDAEVAQLDEKTALQAV